MDVETKYTRVEYERRFLVDPEVDWQSLVEPYSKLIEDKYLTDTRLRLRAATDSDTDGRSSNLRKRTSRPRPISGH
jgi:hypothetical protein